ncbi:META domain-containing protein [Nitrospirillum amazonense]|uniref:META domain-containing protein n=1 Tax=Nitrospirillum amazonense TaxID=28077 RepID=UPI001647C974|nr:META domain-containing protein [Nitrospirillum amazonense]MEC4594399.1 META domain-containing protein [Nitrospirillum amazonense]
MATTVILTMTTGQAEEAPHLPALGRPPVVTQVPVPPPTLAGGRWRIITYFDGVALAAPKLQDFATPANAGQTVNLPWPTITFNTTGALEVFVGCGPALGRYDMTDDKLTLRALAWTINCGTDDTHQLLAVVAAMEATSNLAWRGASALLFDQAGNLQLILSR